MSPVSPAFAGRFFTCWAIREPLIHWALVFLFSEVVLIMTAASRLVLGIKWDNPLFFFWKLSKHSINGNHCYQHHYLKFMKEDQKDLGCLFSHSVLSDPLGPHGLQHARLPCLPPSPRACSNSCPLSRDAIQTSCPLSSPSPPAFSLSQDQGLF